MSFFGKNRQICAQRAFPSLQGRVGSACQRPAEIKQRTANKPLQIFIQGKYPVKNFYRVSHKLEQPTAGTIFLNPKEVNF